MNQKGNKSFGYQHLISPVSFKESPGNFRGATSIARIITESWWHFTAVRVRWSQSATDKAEDGTGWMSGIPTEPAMTPQKQTCLHLCGKDITADRGPTPQYTIVSYLPATTNEVQFITNTRQVEWDSNWEMDFQVLDLQTLYRWIQT
jgi:hypothetical protein